MANEAPEDRIRVAIDRVRRALSRLDSVGRGTARTQARIRDGLTCEVEDGPWRFTADLPAKAGGMGEGPDPGVYGRAALATCLAAGYSMWAAYHDVPLTSLKVEVEADYDARPEYGVTDEPPGYKAVRWIVEVQSPAAEDEILEVMDLAEARSPFLAVFRDPQKLHREVRINR
jgi:uncharacterized OsmC-like protein